MRFFLDGREIPAGRPAVPATDRALLFGDGLYETLVSWNGVPFRPGEHLSRLAAGATAVSFPLPPLKMLELDVRRAAALHRRGFAAVRLTVTGGDGPSFERRGGRPRRLVTVRTHRPPLGLSRRGLAVVTAGAGCGLPGVKSVSCMGSLSARRRAARLGAGDAVLLRGGWVSEGTTSNIFVLKNGVLYTPPPAGRAAPLPGVTRIVVTELWRARGGRCVERDFRPEFIAGADECFLTSSLRGVVAVVRVDGKPVGRGRPGGAALSLASEYWARVRAETNADWSRSASG